MLSDGPAISGNLQRKRCCWGGCRDDGSWKVQGFWVDGHLDVFRSIVTAGEALYLLHIVTIFQGGGLVGLVGDFGGGGDHRLKGWSGGRGGREVPAGGLWGVLRVSGLGWELCLVQPLPRASFSKGCFPAVLFTAEIKTPLKAAVGVDVVLQGVQMNPVRVLRDTAGVFIKGGIRAQICVPRTCQFIAAGGPGQIDSWVRIFLKGRYYVSLEGGEVTGSFVSIRVWKGKAGLARNKEAGIRNHIQVLWVLQGRDVVEMSAVILTLSCLKN